MLLDAVVLEPLAKAADGDAGSLADLCVLILKAELDSRPNLFHVVAVVHQNCVEGSPGG